FSEIQFTTDSREADVYLAKQNETAVWEENSTFAKVVVVNGIREVSAKEFWDASEIGKNILKGSYALGTKMQPFYFAQTGNSALFKANIRYTTNFKARAEYQNDLAGGLYVTDGNHSGFIMAIQNKLLYGDWKWTDEVLPRPVLMYPDPLPAEMAVVLKDGYFHVYVNDNFAAKLSVEEVVPGAAADAEFAFGIYMNADAAADIEFSEIQFTTDSREAASYLAEQNGTIVWEEGSIFAKVVVVNGIRRESAKEAWDTGEIAKNILKGSYAMGSKQQPFYFVETGSSALYQADIAYTTQFVEGTEYQNDLAGGLYVTDGNHSGFIMAIQNKLVYTDWKWTDVVLSEPVLMYPNPVPAKMAVALKGGYFYVYVNDNFAAKLSVEDVVPGAAEDAELAFGIYMSADKTADIQFSNTQFTTDVTAVGEYLLAKDGIFAETVTVNGTEVNSATSVWNRKDELDGILTGRNGKWTEPMILKETGTTALLQTRIENITGNEAGVTYQNDLFGGLWAADGINRGFLLVVGNGIAKGTDTNNREECLDKWVLMHPQNGEGHPYPVELKVARKGGYFYIYLDGNYKTKVKVSEAIPGAADDAELAIGLAMHCDNEAEIKFSNISYTTDAAAVDALLLPEHGIFADSVTVNGNTINSDASVWNRDKELEGILTVRNGGWGQPMILKGTGTASLLQTRIENVGGKEEEGWVRNVYGGLWATDGTHYGFLMAINNSIAVGNALDNRPISLDQYVLMPPESGGENPIELAVARKGEYIYVYVDGVYKKRLAVSDVIPEASNTAELAFGLTMDRGGDGGNSELQFSNTSYTTDAAEVDAFLVPKDGIFADSVTVNGNTINSVTSVWNRDRELDGIMTVRNGGWGQPMLLKGTGTTALLKTRIENITDSSEDWARNVYGGLFATDGTNYGLLMAECDGIAMGGDLNIDFYRGGQYVLMGPTTGGQNPVEMTIARKGGSIYLYLDDVFVKKVGVSEVIPNATDNAELAFGLAMDIASDGDSAGKNAVLQFSNTSYTTDEAAVTAFMSEKGTTE
ncbi:MAG: hypothetical protein HFH87_12160, partial [Lachnospiraceae bacterium]|nr:hypothetical protein [Lachnospiraceae bacterium]